MTRPPRLASRLLAWRLHPDERDELLGDLDEQFAARAARDGHPAARRWYWRQALSLAWGFARDRRDLISRTHERRRGAWLAGNLRHDWGYALRSLRHSPAFAFVAVSTLTFGIGLSTAVFSLVDGILLRPLPYPQADRIVRLGQVRPESALEMALGGVESAGSLADVTLGLWLEEARALELMTPYSTTAQNVRTPRGTRQISTATVGPDFFTLFGIRPEAGRVFGAADANAEAPLVAVISRRFQTREFGAGEDAIGAVLRIEQDDHTIVGVIPDGLDFPAPEIDVLLPGRWRWPAPGARRMFGTNLQTVARLAPHATIADAAQEGERVLRAIAMSDPGFDEGTVTVPLLRVDNLLDATVAPVRGALVTLLAGMALVLAAACVNLAGLLLARNTARVREISVRLALGASRLRLARPLLFEQLLLSTAGGLLGGLLAWWILESLPAMAPADLPRLADVGFNVMSLLFATGAALVTSLVAGLWPAWRVPAGTLRDLSATGRMPGLSGSRSAERARSVLVTAQVALAVTLLVGASLIGRSLSALLDVPPGFRPDGVLTFQISLQEGFWEARGRQHAYFEDLIGRLRADRRVVSAGVSSVLPLHASSFRGNLRIDGLTSPEDPSSWPVADTVVVSPDYLSTLGTRVVSGRGFTAADVDGAQKVALADEALVARYFPGVDLIGKQLRKIGRDPWTIVGIVESIQLDRTTRSTLPALYFPAAQVGEVLAYNRYGGGVAVRVDGDPNDIVGLVRRVTRELDPGAPMFNASPLADRFHHTFDEPRFYAIALALFAALALTTAVLGVYGVLAYAVERRRTELSVRRALGASESHVVGLVMRRSLRLAGAGITLGLAGAAAGSGLLQALLFGVGPLDPVSFAGAAAAVLVVVAVASLQPVRRALRVAPAEALRAE